MEGLFQIFKDVSELEDLQEAIQIADEKQKRSGLIHEVVFL